MFRRFLFLVAFMSLAAVASAGPYVGFSAQYGWANQYDIGRQSVQPMYLGGFEYEVGSLALDLQGRQVFPRHLLGLDRRPSEAEATFTVKLRF